VKQPDQDIFSTLNPAYSGNPVFARHETFHPWFGWLKKGFDAATQDPEVFLREDAPVRLGVGKNMVNAIRYWCNTFKVLPDNASSDNGDRLLKDDGWDPFSEDPATLWLLGVAELRYDKCGQGVFWLPDLPHLSAIEIIGWIGNRNIPKLKIINY
jgi:hypothetical protein